MPIKYPNLVIEAENEKSFPGQPQKVHDALTCQKKHRLFKNEERAGYHCQTAALSLSNQSIFDWNRPLIGTLDFS